MKTISDSNHSISPISLQKKTNRLAYGFIFLGFAVLYWFTCAPGPLWQDSGNFQMRVFWADYNGDLGLALSHPLYIRIARMMSFLPFGEFAWRVNLVSALAGALTIANLFLAVRWLTGRYQPALLAAATCALGHTFWRHTAIAEVYTLNTALLTLEILCLIRFCKSENRRWLYALFFVNGLDWANHNFALLTLFCYGLFVIYLFIKKYIYFRHITILLICWIIGALPYEVLIFRELVSGTPLSSTLHSVLFGCGYQQAVLSTSIPYRYIILYILLNFPTPNLLLLLPGIVILWKGVRSDSHPIRYHAANHKFGPRVLPRILLLMLIVLFLFAVRYRVPDQYAFFMPFYVMASLAIGLSAHHWFAKKTGWMVTALICSLLSIPVYAWGPNWLEQHHYKIPGMKRTIPFRNEYRYFLQPWKHNDISTTQFVSKIENVIPPDSIIIADSTTLYPLLYFQQVKNELQSIFIFSPTQETLGNGVILLAKRCTFSNIVPEQVTSANLDVLLKKHSIYVVSAQKGYCPVWLLDHYQIDQVFPLFQIIKRKPQLPSVAHDSDTK